MTIYHISLFLNCGNQKDLTILSCGILNLTVASNYITPELVMRNITVRKIGLICRIAKNEIKYFGFTSLKVLSIYK